MFDHFTDGLSRLAGLYIAKSCDDDAEQVSAGLLSDLFPTSLLSA
jgi:hypothetical protein